MAGSAAGVAGEGAGEADAWVKVDCAAGWDGERRQRRLASAVGGAGIVEVAFDIVNPIRARGVREGDHGVRVPKAGNALVSLACHLGGEGDQGEERRREEERSHLVWVAQ